jgi:hypothetical protein
MATLDTAQFWVDHGVSVIPLLPKSKLPSQDWRSYQTRLPTYPELKQWFSNGKNNLGIVCGGNQGLVVIDFDSMDGYIKFIQEKVLKSKMWKRVFDSTYRVKTRRGMHLYVRSDQKIQSTKIVADKIDIRSYGNMVVAPPSIHPSGFPYSELSERNITCIDCMDDLIPPKSGQNRAFLGDSTVYPVLDALNIGDIFDEQTQKIIDIRTIKNSLPILDFVSRYTPVRRTSENGRWWMAKCIDPHHNDSNPSLRIDTYRNRVKCLSGSCRLYHEIGLDIIDVYSVLTSSDRTSTIRYFSSLFL